MEGGGAEAVFRYQFDLLKEDYNIDLFYAYNAFTDRKYDTLAYIHSTFWKKKFAAFLKNKHYDRIIIHNYCGALSPSVLDVLARYKKKTACKIIYYAHDFHLVCPNRGYFYMWKGKIINFRKPPAIPEILAKRLDYRGLFYSLLKKIQWIWAYPIRKKQTLFDLVLAPSDFLTDQIRQACPALVVEKMYNVCDAPQVNTEKTNTEKSDTLRMVYFGRIAKEKGLAEFITALRLTDVKYTFTIIGEGDEKPHIQSLVYHHNLQDNVFFRTKLDASTLFSELQNFDVYVLPSLWYENAPLSIVEAASLGLGLFLANHGGVKEIGRICGATHFFDPSDSADIVRNLAGLYRDFQNDTLPKANRELLQTLFSKEVYVQNLTKYLNE